MPLFFQQIMKCCSTQGTIRPVKRTGARPTGGYYKQARLIQTATSDVAVLNIYGVCVHVKFRS
jgi:hypothetical protein